MPVALSDRFAIERPLGRGGFGHTLLATDVRLRRKVALKLLHPATARDWKAYQLFEREAAVLGDLRHPGIPLVHETLEAEWDGATAAVMVMEYIEGPSLAELIADGTHQDPEDVLSLFVDLLGLLDYLHSRVPPVLHRDIKPANIIVRPGGSPALVDFGAVRNVFRDADEPGSTVVGTHGYMPYEQTMGQASPSSDLYALAATMLHLFTGRPPGDFMGEDGHLRVPDQLPCGEPLRGVLATMLNHAPAGRYPNARAVRQALITVPPGPTTVPAIRPLALPASPAERRALIRRASYSTWDIMNSDGEPGTSPSVVDAVLITFFSAITIGIMPAIFLSRAIARRRRITDFVRHGVPAVATILEMHEDKIEFGCRLIRVRYAFEAGGRRHLGTDRVLPSAADRWEVGGLVGVVYRGDQDYRSVIVDQAY